MRAHQVALPKITYSALRIDFACGDSNIEKKDAF
jgi:hypothetical protein